MDLEKRQEHTPSLQKYSESTYSSLSKKIEFLSQKTLPLPFSIISSAAIIISK
jgi:hypothetical protein